MIPPAFHSLPTVFLYTITITQSASNSYKFIILLSLSWCRLTTVESQVSCCQDIFYHLTRRFFYSGVEIHTATYLQFLVYHSPFPRGWISSLIQGNLQGSTPSRNIFLFYGHQFYLAERSSLWPNLNRTSSLPQLSPSTFVLDFNVSECEEYTSQSRIIFYLIIFPFKSYL